MTKKSEDQSVEEQQRTAQEQVQTEQTQQGEVVVDSGSGEDQVQAKFDEAAEKGYFGETPDETPNEAYTLKGVNEGQDTPETTRGDSK
jgi:hypothetical protein